MPKNELKNRPCLICGFIPSDICHVKTRGSHSLGDDINKEWNLMPLCRNHHQEQHRIGIITFINRYANVHMWMAAHNWEIENGRLLRKN